MYRQAVKPVPNHGLGRPRGATNHATKEIREFAHEFFSSKEYRQRAMQRILDGQAPTLEIYLLQLRYGKPRETIDLHVTQQNDLSSLSVEELEQRAKELLDQLADVKELEEAIPASYKIA